MRCCDRRPSSRVTACSAGDGKILWRARMASFASSRLRKAAGVSVGFLCILRNSTSKSCLSKVPLSFGL